MPEITAPCRTVSPQEFRVFASGLFGGMRKLRLPRGTCQGSSLVVQRRRRERQRISRGSVM